MAKEMHEIIGKLHGMILDDESRNELYKERIKRFPNLMEECFDYTKDHWLSLYKKLENSLNNDIVFGLEDEIRHKNAMVFILWQLQKQIQAEKLANEVLKKGPDNLVALTNLAFIHLYNENIIKLEEVMDYLSNLEKEKNFPQIEAVGKMNVAYCLSRISFNDYERAIKLYKEASSDSLIKYSCQFGIALLHYRCLRNIYDKKKINEIIKEAIQHLEEIRCAFPHNIDETLMGKTLSLLALFKVYPLKHSSRKPFKKDYQFYEIYVQRALHFSPNDRYVLEKSANFYKVSNQIDKAEKMFLKAIEINETAFSHHHLGLTYQRMNSAMGSYFPVKKHFSHEENLIGKLIKYPKEIPHIKRNDSIDKIEYHFQEALKLSPENSPALYDLILLYMTLKEYKNAGKYCEKFKTNIKIQDVSFNILYGRLYFLLAEEETDEKVKEELKGDGTDRFFLAITSAIEFFPFQKKLKDIWGIKEIMTDVYNYGYIEINKSLLELIESVEELPSDEELYDKLLMDCDENEVSRKIRKLCKDKQYFHAYFFCLTFSEVNVKINKEIYVNLAKHFTERNPECSKEFFRKCYDLCCRFDSKTNIEMMSEHSKNFHYDIYILTSPNGEQQLAENIGMNLEKYFGLKVTFHNHDYILGEYKIVNLCTILKHSCNIGILLEHSNITSPEFLIHTKLSKQIMEDRQPKIGQLFMINNHKDIEIPKHLESFPQLKCQSGHRDDIENIFNFLCDLH